MAGIQGELTLTSIDHKCRLWQLEHDLSFNDITVPMGYITDGASTYVFRPFLPAWGTYSRAAVIHDWLCTNKRQWQTPLKGYETFKKIDNTFFDAMTATNVNVFVKYIMWMGVRTFHSIKYGMNH